MADLNNNLNEWLRFAVPSKFDASKNTCKIVVMGKISVKFQ